MGLRAWLLGVVLVATNHGVASTLVRLDKQDQHMSRVVVISTDAGASYKPVWAGVKEGVIDHPGAQYNFFCAQVTRPSRYKEVGVFTVVPASPRITAMLSRVHDLGQVNADAAAGMQLAVWELEEDDEVDLFGGNFRARPTIVVKWWADMFLREAEKPALSGSEVYVVAHPTYQSMVVMNYVPAVPPIPGGAPNGAPGLSYLPWGGRANEVPVGGTLYLVAAGLAAMWGVLCRR